MTELVFTHQTVGLKKLSEIIGIPVAELPTVAATHDGEWRSEKGRYRWYADPTTWAERDPERHTKAGSLGWKFDEILDSQRRRVAEQYADATVDDLREALAQLRTWVYPLDSVLDTVVNPCGESTTLYSYLQPQFTDDGKAYADYNGDAIPDGRELEWINAGDVRATRLNDDFQDATLDDAVVLLASAGSAGPAAMINGTVTVGVVRRLLEETNKVHKAPEKPA